MGDRDTEADLEGQLAKLIQELWKKKVHEPAVFGELEAQRKALRLNTLHNVLLLSGLTLATLLLSFWLDGLFAVVGVVIGLVIWRKKAHELAIKKEALDHLIGPPGEAFPSIAVNKIEGEARGRSPELERYIAAVNKGGRYRLTAYEVKMIVRILSTLERLETT